MTDTPAPELNSTEDPLPPETNSPEVPAPLDFRAEELNSTEGGSAVSSAAQATSLANAAPAVPTPEFNGMEGPPPPLPSGAATRGRVALPSSPVERAKLESQFAPKNELNDRSTQVAFGLLFVLPLLIIILAVLLLIPFMNAQMTREPDGVPVRSGPNMPPPSR